MKQVIFGSGIVGMLARHILGDDWQIVPFYRSRLYSHSPPLGDNYVSCDDAITNFVGSLGLSTIPVWYQRAYSVGGELVKRPGYEAAWLSKVFGDDYPAHAVPYLKARPGFFVYDGVRVNGLYRSLQERHSLMLRAEAAKGRVTAIGDHYFVRGGVREEYQRAISTIPLGALINLLKRDRPDLPVPEPRYGPIQYLHLLTQHLDFEGANQVLVTDRVFGFFKVTRVAQHRFVFQCHQDIKDPGSYFMPILADYDLIEGTSIKDALPLGPMADVKWLEPYDIFPVGSYAQHDWCADVGSNMLRLLRYAERGYSPARLRPVGT